MNINQFAQIQEKKPDSRNKAIASLILGIFSGIPLISIVLIGELVSRYFPEAGIWLGPLLAPLALIFFISPFIGIIGLILGIMGLKSTKRNFAIAGIALCIIGLVVPILYFVFY